MIDHASSVRRPRLARSVSFAAAIGAAALIGLAGCTSESSSEGETSRSDSSNVTTVAWKLDAAPDGAVDVGAAKQSVKEGDSVVIRGRIGGRAAPIVEGSPVFVMMDPAIPICQDACPVPWDYCCETPETIAANNATVQLVGDDGALLDVDLEAGGLSPADEVIVVGTVGPRPEANVLVIRATGIHRVSG